LSKVLLCIIYLIYLTVLRDFFISVLVFIVKDCIGNWQWIALIEADSLMGKVTHLEDLESVVFIHLSEFTCLSFLTSESITNYAQLKVKVGRDFGSLVFVFSFVVKVND
jgi:hypothetical protein